MKPAKKGTMPPQFAAFLKKKASGKPVTSKQATLVASALKNKKAPVAEVESPEEENMPDEEQE